MYGEIMDKVGDVAVGKLKTLKKSKIKYLLLSAMAGMFVGIGILLIMTIGGTIGDSPYKKMIMGMTFGIALSLVLVIGSELFTGNNFIMIVGSLQKKVPWSGSIKIWIYSYFGNLIGSLVLAWLYVSTGLTNGKVGSFILKVSLGKMTLSGSELFFRGLLCNFLVCLGVFCFIKMKSESAKLIMIFWCLFAFITIGLEHSIANMTIFGIALLLPHTEVINLGGAIHNLAYVTAGNFIGGALLLGAVYWFIGSEE